MARLLCYKKENENRRKEDIILTDAAARSLVVLGRDGWRNAQEGAGSFSKPISGALNRENETYYSTIIYTNMFFIYNCSNSYFFTETGDLSFYKEFILIRMCCLSL